MTDKDALRSEFEAWYRDKYQSTLYCCSRWEAWQAASRIYSDNADRCSNVHDNRKAFKGLVK